MQKDFKKDFIDKDLSSNERRQFLKLSASFGITAAMIALSKNALGSGEAVGASHVRRFVIGTLGKRLERANSRRLEA